MGTSMKCYAVLPRHVTFCCAMSATLCIQYCIALYSVFHMDDFSSECRCHSACAWRPWMSPAVFLRCDHLSACHIEAFQSRHKWPENTDVCVCVRCWTKVGGQKNLGLATTYLHFQLPRERHALGAPLLQYLNQCKGSQNAGFGLSGRETGNGWKRVQAADLGRRHFEAFRIPLPIVSH